MKSFKEFIAESYKKHEQLPWSEHSHCGRPCGEASLKAFGIEHNGPSKWAHVQVAMTKSGYKLHDLTPRPKWNHEKHEIEIKKLPKVRDFLKQNPTGHYLATTTDHIMAIRDGQLTDTEFGSGGRRIREIRKVTKD